MSKSKKLNVQGVAITFYENEKNDYISLTDIARYKETEHTDTVIQNWLRNRNTVELLGFWEILNNPNFNPLEFEGVRRQTGLNSFVLTPKRWIEATNALLIRQGLSQAERLVELNKTAIAQMKTLIAHQVKLIR